MQFFKNDLEGLFLERPNRFIEIYTDRFSECDIAKGLKDIGGIGIPNFGSSDCSCSSHLYYFKEDPVRNRAFLDLLHHFRHSYSKK